MRTTVFESKLLPDGHLYCPEEFVHKKNITFNVIVTFRETYLEASDNDIERSAVHDAVDDFLCDEELNYYLNLKEL